MVNATEEAETDGAPVAAGASTGDRCVLRTQLVVEATRLSERGLFGLPDEFGTVLSA